MDPELNKIQSTDGIRNMREQGYFDKFADEDDEKLCQDTTSTSQNVGAYESIDWSNTFGPAGDQGRECKAGWAFAVTGVLESLRNRSLKKDGGYFSPQHLLECVSGSGCNGGDIGAGFQRAKFGVYNETDYPYKGTQGTCPGRLPKKLITYITAFDFCYFSKCR